MSPSSLIRNLHISSVSCDNFPRKHHPRPTFSTVKFFAWKRIASKSSGFPLFVTKQFLFGHFSKGPDPKSVHQGGLKNKIRLTRFIWFSCGTGAFKGRWVYFEFRWEVPNQTKETRTKIGTNPFHMEQLETDQSIAWNQEIRNLPILKIIQSCVIPEAALVIKHNVKFEYWTQVLIDPPNVTRFY